MSDHDIHNEACGCVVMPAPVTVAPVGGGEGAGVLTRDQEAILALTKEIAALREEVEAFKSFGIIEIMVRNPNVDSWVKECDKAIRLQREEITRLQSGDALREMGALLDAATEDAENHRLDNQRLQARVARLEAALREIENHADTLVEARHITRRALADEEGKG